MSTITTSKISHKMQSNITEKIRGPLRSLTSMTVLIEDIITTKKKKKRKRKKKVVAMWDDGYVN